MRHFVRGAGADSWADCDSEAGWDRDPVVDRVEIDMKEQVYWMANVGRAAAMGRRGPAWMGLRAVSPSVRRVARECLDWANFC